MSGITVSDSQLTKAQKVLIAEIEIRTSAKVILTRNLPEFGLCYEGFLSLPEDGDDENEDDWRDTPGGHYYPWSAERGELCYIRISPSKTSMTEQEITAYPPIPRRELEYSRRDNESCNILLTVTCRDDIDSVLTDMFEYSMLLNMGWRLAKEESFDDPFIPEEEPKTEEELMWEEYLDEKQTQEEKRAYEEALKSSQEHIYSDAP